MAVTSAQRAAARSIVYAMNLGIVWGAGVMLAELSLLVSRIRASNHSVQIILNSGFSVGATQIGVGVICGLLFYSIQSIDQRVGLASRTQISEHDVGSYDTPRRPYSSRAASLVIMLGFSASIGVLLLKLVNVPTPMRRLIYAFLGTFGITFFWTVVARVIRPLINSVAPFVSRVRSWIIPTYAIGLIVLYRITVKKPEAIGYYVVFLFTTGAFSVIVFMLRAPRMKITSQILVILGAVLWIGSYAHIGTTSQVFHLLRMGRTLSSVILRELPVRTRSPIDDQLVLQAMNPPMLDIDTAIRRANVLVPTGTRPGSLLVLVTIDTLRNDRLEGRPGARSASMPSLASFAGEGVLFQHAIASAPATIGALTQVLMGRPERAIAHLSVRSNVPAPTDPSTPTIASQLRAHGYETTAILGGRIASYYPSLAQGFSQVVEARGPAHPSLHASDLVDDFAHIRSRRDPTRPWFVWLHFIEPHDHDALPLPLVESYDHLVRSVDDQLGRLFRMLREDPSWENSTVLVLADHGEGLGEQGLVHHGVSHPLTLQIPFVARFPGQQPSVVDVPISQLDVAPTLLTAAGLGATHLPGRPLQSHQTEAFRQRDAVFFENVTYTDVPLVQEFGLVSYPWFYLYDVRARRPVLIDLGADPQGLTNVSDGHPLEIAAFGQRLRESLRSDQP